jgi:flagellar basal-body rod protein FlgF
MSDGIYSAASGAVAQQRALEAVANNVANVNTTGFRADKTVFAEVLKKIGKTELPTEPSLRYGTVSQLSVDTQPGALELTKKPLDVGLHGDGYLTVRTPQGERYTRAGAFVIDQQGVLKSLTGHEVMKEGRKLTKDPNELPAGERIIIPRDTKEVYIGQDGQISADNQRLGKLKLVQFDKQIDALREGYLLFTNAPGKQPKPAGKNLTVEQGYLETANVNAVSGMNELIMVSRAFEALEKVIDTFRQLDDRTARDVGGRV